MPLGEPLDGVGSTGPAIDPELGLLYINAGNPSPVYEETTRHGINLFANAILALRLDTGALAWYYQAIHHGVAARFLADPHVAFPVDIDLLRRKRPIFALGPPAMSRRSPRLEEIALLVELEDGRRRNFSRLRDWLHSG